MNRKIAGLEALQRELDHALGLPSDERVREIVEELEEEEFAPMPPDEIERILAKVRRRKMASPERGHATESFGAASDGRTLKARSMAATAAAAVLVMVSGGAYIWWRWSGQRAASELSYEHAIQVYGDMTYTEQERRSALGGIYASLQQTVDALKQASAEGFETDACNAARAVMRSQVTADRVPVVALRDWELRQLRERVQERRASRGEIGRLATLCAPGIYLLGTVTASDGPHGPLAQIWLDDLVRRLSE